MSPTDQDRLLSDRLQPDIVQLWLALQALRSTIGFMQSGAHPDDETSQMLAVLRFRDGYSTSYVCANRGEGGQNSIGRETREDLGVVRTAEMERAAQMLDMRLWWLSEGVDDTIFDFGLSKSGTDTLNRWGEDRTLARFVSVIRAERPDILCPTFLDIPGQHGHHRAMTELAHRVVAAAADPRFTGCDLPVWQISKLYLPAWGGGGGSYDDELPPPVATITIAAKGTDPMTGWSYANMGEYSRRFHRTQGMGSWVPAGSERDWPLHLAISAVGNDVHSPADNLPKTCAEIGLADAQRYMDDAVAAFPDHAAVASAAAAALADLRDHIRRAGPENAHRITRKEQELSRVLRLAAGIGARGLLTDSWLQPGDQARLMTELRQGRADKASLSLSLPAGWSAKDDVVSVTANEATTPAYAGKWDPASPELPALALQFSVAGISAECTLPLDETPQIVPVRTAKVQPSAVLVNLAGPKEISVTLTSKRPENAVASFVLPEGWAQHWRGDKATLTPPDGLAPGLTQLVLQLDGQPCDTENRLSYPHIQPRIRSFPASLTVRVANVVMPQLRIGYVGGGNDNVLHWLTEMGLQVSAVSDADLSTADGLAKFETLVIGVFAFRSHPKLARSVTNLHRWVDSGGNLVTLYHRPGDNWDADTTPPRRIEIGMPSIRWRVTDENAAVTHLCPDHPLLNHPNVIGPEDWAGWHKERGLYFAKSWDPAYVPLVEMADPGEAPLAGALLSAQIGAGRHSHVALGLHHQLEQLTPGAYRLMANLLAK